MCIFNRISSSHTFSDLSDRLCTTVTSFLLIVAAILVFLKQQIPFLGIPMTCWTPATFTEEWTAYTNRYCYRAKDYWLLHYQAIPAIPSNGSGNDMDYHRIRKDHFVVWMLVSHALQFYFLRLLWAVLSTKCSTDLSSILKVSSHVAKISEPKSRQSQMMLLSQFVHNSISKCGILLSILYLVAKFLFVVNIFTQIYTFQQFLEVDNFWGYKLVNNMNNGIEWESIPAFPRVTLCDLEIRVLGNVHRYTVQCNLDITYFLTSVHLIIWYWMSFVALISVLSFIYWIIITITSFIPPTRNMWIRKFLNAVHCGKTPAPFEMNRLGSQLKPDGLMILHFVASHANEMVASELAGEIFNSQNRNTALGELPVVNPTAPEERAPLYPGFPKRQ